MKKRSKCAKPRPSTGAKVPPASTHASLPFPIVGIGASAGGLEALEVFFASVPPRTRTAFVVVQHMDPTRKALLAELLQRASRLEVVEVTDGARVEPGHVYVIPPNKDLSLVDGALHALPPAEPRGLRLPIDFFFRSLALELREKSIGVLLSGMGSDGTQGLRAIREHAGASFVQATTSAKFDAMPRSAIDAGLADVVAPVEQLFARIAEYVGHPTRTLSRGPPAPARKTDDSVEKVVALLREATGHDFSLYKSSTIHRRVERRMQLHQIGDVPQYVRFLRANPSEAELLFKELLIGVTNFFRDPEAWDQLRDELFPKLLAKKPKGAALRAWVAACSTGEEAYSLAMTFREALERADSRRNVTLQIFATDLDASAIEKARQGFYGPHVTAEISPERLARFFVQEDGGYRVRKEIRDLVIFATQNVLQDPPFTKIDLLTCRNLLIYLTSELQQKLLPLLHYSLNPGGLLFLGGSETVGSFTDLFTPALGALGTSKNRLYQRLETVVGSARSVDLPHSFRRVAGLAEPQPTGASARGTAPPNLQAFVEARILAQHSPAAVLTGGKGDVLYISGRTGKYLEPPAGRANWNVFAMAREGLRHPLASAFQKALVAKSAVKLAALTIGTNGGTQVVDVTVERVDEPASLRGTMMIVFADARAALGNGARKAGRGRELSLARTKVDDEVRRLRDELRTTHEEMQSSQEELRSANEELQSTNEELQSTNEELTTSKEEMQSMNEELQTLNHELQAKVDELSCTSNDMKNLLDSTEIAILFLDQALNVRRFTPQAATVIKLIPGDVGRPLADLASTLTYPDLSADARDVLRTLVFKEKVVGSTDGRAFDVRIMPYRTTDNRIDGVVITLSKRQGTKGRRRNAPETPS